MDGHELLARIRDVNGLLFDLAQGRVSLAVENDRYLQASSHLEYLSVLLIESNEDIVQLVMGTRIAEAVETCFEHIIAHHDECNDPESTLAYECAQMILAIVRRCKHAGTFLRCLPTLSTTLLDARMSADVRQTAADTFMELSYASDRSDGNALACLKLWSGLHLSLTEKWLIDAGSYALQEAILQLLWTWPHCAGVFKVLLLLACLQQPCPPVRCATQYRASEFYTLQ
eukprot:scaffold223119_cov30-Tisochrysis_lutea.AAC.2